MKIPQSKDLTLSSLIHHPGSAPKTWKLALLSASIIVPCLSVQGALLAELDVQYVLNNTTYDINDNIPEGHTLIDWKIWKFPEEENGTYYDEVTSASPEMAGGSGQISRTLSDTGQDYQLGAGGISGFSFTWTDGASPYGSGTSSGPIPVATGWAGTNATIITVDDLQPGVTYELQFFAAGFFRDPTVSLASGGSDNFDTDETYLDNNYQTRSSIVTIQFDTETVDDVLTLVGGMGDWGGGALGARLTATGETDPDPDPEPEPIAGWTEFVPVESNGTRNSTDPGSRIAYVDAVSGSNSTGEYYWWNGTEVVDSNGDPYGTDPMNPTGSIMPFQSFAASGAPEFRGNPLYDQTHYADWVLFKRGQEHDFDYYGAPQAGRSPEEPAVLGAYGSLSLDRPHLMEMFRICNCGDAEVTNLVILSLQLGTSSTDGVLLNMDVPEPPYYYGDRNDARSWFWFEDVLIDGSLTGFTFLGVADVTINRSIVTNVWSEFDHNQGAYVEGPEISLRVEESIFYHNGMKSDPVTDPTPGRDVFSRNFYIGGGEHMGIHFNNVISADGGSGGPQVRYGGIVERSLLIEGYWFTSTDSNDTPAPWLDDNMETFEFRNNVQLVFQQPLPGAPSDPTISVAAQPGAGFSILLASAGVFEDNIISGVVLDELGFSSAVHTSGIDLNLGSVTNSNGTIYSSSNLIQNNILYRVAGLYANGTTNAWGNSGTQEFINNQWYDRGSNYALSSASGISTFNSSLEIDGNTFYSDETSVVDGGSLSSWKSAVMGTNQLLARSQAPWSDPDRSLKTYAQNVLGLTVTSDSGLEEFFDVATAMRKGQWNEAYTAAPIVDYIRDGFDLDPVE